GAQARAFAHPTNIALSLRIGDMDQPIEAAFGLARIEGFGCNGDAEANAAALLSVLKGTKGPFRDVAVFNAAAALVVAGRAENLKDGVAVATKSLDSGEAEGRLDRLVHVSNA
ncbi:MAG: hypothetical protein ACJ8ED_14565, partial [Xanthobacteraceae bacterium]